MMPATVIVGGQWGDEGKAKVVDYLMPNHDVVIRFQGGANAGHTVVNDQGKFAFHQIPSGVLYPHVTALLGNGMVIDPVTFLSELEELMSRGINVSGRILISSAAHLVMQHHRILDNLYESDLKERSIGSTGKGIGPAYCDKHGRKSLRMSLFLLEKEEIFECVKRRVEDINRMITMYGAPPLDAEKQATDFVNIGDLIRPMVVDSQETVFRFKAEGKRIMLEGAQGTLLDIDHGTYPYVTSSSCTVGGALTGSGLNVGDIGRVIGIFKAYTTRVGNGPFPTELDDEIGDQLRERGGEYGTTTGRPRRCGWFDLVAARYAVGINGLHEVALTKLDVVSNISEVHVCTAYELDGKRIERFPHDAGKLSRCTPIYEELPGWELDPKAVGTYEDLPEKACRFVEFIEKGMGVKATFISLGPERDNTILREAAYSFDSKR
jgi:adenylosuccinate synthase